MADSLSLSRNVQSLFETLRSKSPHRGSQAAQLASDLYTLCIESVSSTELAYCSSVLFSKENGILRFLKDAASLEEFVTCKEKLLDLLSAFINILGEKIRPYALEIKEVCVMLFSRDKTSKVKNATFPPLIAVLKLCRVQPPLVESLKIPKLADKYFQACLQPTKHTATVRAGIFQLLGSLCEVYPEHMITYSERLVDIYMRTLRTEMLSKSKKKPEMPVIGGCLRGLCSYLTNFSQSVAEGSAYAQDIYKFTRMAIDPEVSLTRYEVPRAGLSLIAGHAAQFKEYLAKDYEHMYSCLFQWCGHNNRENKQIALMALDAFLQQVSIHIVEGASKDHKTNAAIFREFIKNFRAIIDSKTSGHRELAVAIKGYGYFAAPCKIFMKPEDVHFMFTEMVQRSEQLFFSPVESSDDRLFHLPSFLEALSSIVKEMEELSESFLLSLEKLLVLLFECFPLIPPVHHKPTYYAVVRMVMGIANSRTTLKTFLSHIVYQGLIRTCSHPVVMDVGDGGVVVSVEGGGGDLLGGKRASYQDYVDLWMHLMDPTHLKGVSVQLRDHGSRQLVHQILYDEVLSAILRIVHRLNLSSKSPLTATQDASSESPTPSPDEATSAAATSDPISGLLPSVPKDFQIFINLVDLCRTLLPNVQPLMFERWVHMFGREMIIQSSRLPMVSGFYKLLATCLKICKMIGYFKDVSADGAVGGDVVAMETDVTDKQACFILFRKFVKEVLVRMRQYKDDLLASCLQLLLSLPNELVRHEFQALVPALQSTFKLGLSFLPLANTGLDALEAWNAELPAELLKPHFRHILPYLDDYLKTLGVADSQSEGGGTVTVHSRSSRGGRVPVKVIAQWKEGIEGAESPLSKVRSRIVHFLGSLGGEINAGLVESESAASYAAKAVAWDSKKRLELALPFQDMKPSLFLDPFLPRVCELAVSSSDRQTKVAACELLHAMVLFLIGKSAQPAAQKKSPMTKLYRKIFPFVLQLACDVEKVAEQLFHPLVFQMIHWFTRNTQYESPDTIALLDAILDGVIHPTDTSLRDFSALCVREFLVWSIKQTTKKQQERSPINTKSLLKRLYSLASHPSAAKRLGAALTFNSIYTVFREEGSLVDVFVMEMLVVNINSLKLAHRDDKSLGTQEQTCQAIGHLARIIRVKAPLLNNPNKNRRVPKGLKVAEMATLLSWLLLQCGSPETEARQQCMTLFVQFAPLIPKVPNARTWIRKTMESEGGFYFVSRFEKGGHGYGGIQRQPVLSGGTFSLSESVAWLEGLLAALECYNWVLREQLIAPSEVLQLTPKKASDKPSCLLQSLEFFITQLSLRGIEAATQCYTTSYSSVHTPREEEEYNRAKCTVVLRVLKFTAVLLTHHPKEAFSCTPHTFWSDQLLRLVACCCLRPTSIGFDTGDTEVMQTLPKEALETLKAFANHFAPELKASFIDIVASEISPGGSCDLIGRLPLYLHGNNEQRCDHDQLKGTVNGHLLLQKAGLLVPTLETMGHSADDVVLKLLDLVLGTLKPLVSQSPDSSTGSSGGGNLLSPASEQTTGLLLALALEIGVTPSTLVDCLLDYSSDCAGLGLMLYQSFPYLLNAHFVTQHQLFLSHLVENSCKKPQTVSAVLNGFLEHLSRDKSLRKYHGSQVCGCVLSQWSKLGSWWGERFSADQRLGAINLLKKLLSLEPKLLTLASPAELEPVLNMYLTLLEETKSSLTFKSKVLEVLHHFTDLPEEQLKRLKASINKLIAQQFPLKSTEFPPGSPQFNEYISVIDKLLSALMVSGSLVLLELLISIMCREEKHVHEEQIQASLVKFITDLPSSAAKLAIDVSYCVFTNERGYPPGARRGAAERVCMTLLRSCSEVALREFFLEHVGEIMATIEANLSKSSLESQLVSKICCFQFVEVLYTRLPPGALNNLESKINMAYSRGQAKTGKEMTQAVTKAAHTAKSEDLHGDKTLHELRRVYHCMAYNLLVAVITCTQNKMQFYTGFLFKEDVTKGQFLWDNLMDHDKVYHFEVEFESPLDRKKQMTAIRDEIHAEGSRESSPIASPPLPPRYLSSQYLADSSLSADISQFDFSSGTQAFPTVNIGSQPDTKETSYVLSEEQIEQDELNKHECMLPLMKLLDHMEHNKINPVVPKGTTPDDMPSWMAALHKKLNTSHTHRNIRLFIARLISNRPKIFQPYAKYWLPGLVQLIVGGAHGGEGLHYFVVDLLVTMLSWSTTAVMEDEYLANRLLEYLMEHSHHDNRSVFRNNLEIIKTLVECWREKLQGPTKIIYNNFSSTNPESKANRTGIQLLGIVVANKMLPYDPVTAGSIDEQKFYTTFVSLMSHKYKEVYAAAAEVLGMVLASLNEEKHYTLDNLQDQVVQQLMSLASDRNDDKFLSCLHKIQLGYPKITERFVEKLLFLIPGFHGVFRSMCLEVLHPQADIRPNFYRELKDKGFHTMLTHRDEPTQEAALKIVQGMLRHLDQEQTSTLLPLVTAFGSHSSQTCRLLMYNILIWIYSNMCPADGGSPADEATKKFVSDVRDQLLQGLADNAEIIRLKMYAFWNEESRLASDTLGRLTQLLAVLYSTGTEQQFLYHSTNLLLELTSRSPDFNRSMFDSPLSECKFEEYTGIDLSWQQRHLQMTPLFAATLASQPGQTQSEAYGGTGEGMLRATQQAMAFTPTQDAGGDSSYNWMAPSLQSLDPSFTMGSVGRTQSSSTSASESLQSSLLFSKMRPPKRPLRAIGPGEGFGKERLRPDETASLDPQEQQRREIMKLKRRFLKDRKTTSIFFARSEAKRKIMREEHRRHQKAARDSRVVMYRKYRVGELPDIQIKHSELIRPFQALAQRDNSLARMLFASLFKSVFAEVDHVLTDREAESTKRAVRDGLNAVMEASTQFYPPFIGSLQDICFTEKQLDLNPAAVSTASLTSKQEPIGIMLLERQLLCTTEGARPAKRARGAAAPLPESTIAWVELARLYKSLGDYDVLHGVFSRQIGTKPITREALEAEERRDYFEALRLYKEAVACENWSDGPPTQVEEDLWDDSMLECYSHLTEWGDLEKAALVNVDDSPTPRLERVWEDSYFHEHYLPHIMHSKLKLACSGLGDPNFSTFLDRSLQDPDKKALLESRYSHELALYSILKDDLDRARYYTGNCLRTFLQDWSNLDQLLVKSRAAQLQGLQSLTEMQEYLSLMASSDTPSHFEITGAVDTLLTKWHSRFPHPKLDPISVWDDIVTTRCMMMRKLLEHFHNNPASTASDADSMEVDGSQGVDLPTLQERFSREITTLYLRVADSACQQSNYAVATRYLKLTESAIKEYFPSDVALQLQWLHSVAEMRVQQVEQDPSPTKIEPLISLVDRISSLGKEAVLSSNHALARRHHLLEGRVFNQLAQAFKEEGIMLLDTGVLPDPCMKQLKSAISVPTSSKPSPNEISHKLLLQALASLKHGMKSGTAEHKATGESGGMVQALVNVANFCDRALRAKEDEDGNTPLDTSQFPSVVMTYTLKAMQYGSDAATQQFPRLLQLVELYPETMEAFKKKSQDVPNWKFIAWISQMVALLDKHEGAAVHSILLSLATDYPQALCYPFKISSSNFKFDSTPEGKANQEAMEKLKVKVDNKLISDFVTALEQLSSPELVLKDFVDNDVKPMLEQTVTQRNVTELKKAWKNIYSQLLDYRAWDTGPSSSLFGSEATPSLQVGPRQKRFAQDYVKKLEDMFGRDGSKLAKMKLADLNSHFNPLFESMRVGLNKTTGKGLLKEYSPWLHNFQANMYPESIEIPGQYDGKSKPLPDYHVRISGFDEKVLVMSSIRKPKRLTIRGDDEKEYMFLVKGGEDLRMDQRIEQLFGVMNKILMEDSACSQRGLRLKTYQVIPMTPRVGLIEWIENTKPLKDFLQEALTEEESKHYSNGLKWHKKWLEKYGRNDGEMYRNMYRKASRTEVEKEYRKKVTSAPWDLLRRAFMQLAASPEAFLTLRSHFVRTIASISSCQYILGIGDRHLSNFMVDLESGGIVGIDFGHNFGTATQFLPFPELMPFRLTPQISHLLLPHSESGQLRSCMVHTLRALRNSPELLLNTMDVFVKEPSLDWKSLARKQAKIQKLSEETYSQDGAWYPREKLKQAEKKLLGYNPAYVMRTDLKAGHHKTQEYPALEAILMGDKQYNKRARVREKCNSVEEQVECLMDHATDPNILGRVWGGWEPWV